jgi:hypothetical protein
MDPNNHSPDRGPADIFAEAAARVQSGEALESVLASYPIEYEQNLRQLLTIIGVARQIHEADVPSPSRARRAANKAAFLQAAASKHTEQMAVAAARPAPVRTAAPMLRERLFAFWNTLEAIFSVRTMRLAPVVFTLLILLLASTTVVTLAQSAVPGDFTYPVKQWIRYQELYLTPVEQRADVRRAQEQEVVEDVKKAEAKADLRQVVITAEAELLVHSTGENYYSIGGLQVLPKYQPDPNQLHYNDMLVVGDLVPGKSVSLIYQILPGQQASADAPVVQGILLRVLDDQPLEPTPLPTPTPVLTATPTRGV